MLFPTGEFLLLFLSVTLVLFFAIARFAGRQAAAAWLVVASLIFYGNWRPVHVWLLMASIAVNYWAGGLILEARLRGQQQHGRRLLAATLAANLLLLAAFKYANFLLSTIGAVTGWHTPALDIALPLGISFFTFTQIAYLVDVHAGKAVERSPVAYALFVTYFPHLIAGPVLHHAQMMPQFREPSIYFPQLRNLATGTAFLLLGMFKKVVVADSFAPIANQVFAASGLGALHAEEAWRGVLAYTLQIYFDFSGYSDMAVGLSMLFNVRLPYNFNSPYQALNIIDFWRRWHMSLSAFLRDYLYVPLGGSRRGSVRRYANLLITMLLGGLWHGASWTFVVWGGLHGIYLVVNHGWRHLRAVPAVSQASASSVARFVGPWVASALTLLCVVVAWVFFRAASLGDALQMLRAMAGTGGTDAVIDAAAGYQWLWIAAFLLLARLAPNSQQLIDERLPRWIEGLLPSRRLAWRAASIGAGMVIILLLVAVSESRSITEFIYFNF